MATNLRRVAEQDGLQQVAPVEEGVRDVEAPKGTLLVVFLYLLGIAAMWSYVYFRLLRSA
ncbi:hypothetical protein Tmar_0256 [Thermaerobacter marianensis DSM 12885]|uniref:Uncharacterized protein n=1 Tax=Thermaerobacter marianensis (strain ATCC 700841 / DSM 12885 / JCM 10246 / 7p75a) TaxID=644966 RepID=E6SM51_THEM7|nr:hypothetical protein [Thermaerobacter marianensis]ADU50381.1 hypothetical protein Tmar_0256 [Thermaerobacter marianensis DSM 12885]